MVGSTPRSTRRHAKAPARRSTQKPCALCQAKVEWVDYKNVTLLRSYMSDRGKIRARTATGICVRHQGEVSVAIKTARELVLLPRGDTKNETARSESPQMAGATGSGRS
jgi:small subunit ribosomal protein S18